MHAERRPTMILAVLCAVMTGGLGSRVAEVRLDLREGWAIQSSAKVTAGGEAVSRPGFATAGWHRATVPTTVVSALVADGTYPDPYYGTNLREIPGATYKIGTNFSNVPMPDDSPFTVPWWYRSGVHAARRGGRQDALAAPRGRQLQVRGVAQRARRSPTRRRPRGPSASTNST